MERKDTDLGVGMESAHSKVARAQVAWETAKKVTKCLLRFVLHNNYVSVDIFRLPLFILSIDQMGSSNS